ncbi:MAG: hypothetical protein GC178_17260 [Flavobacteriales bacterium]|nr:hypothetical protein [Flavobacteriales bacterium]
MKHLFAFFLFLISTLANAQTACDSLEFVSIQYSSFTDSVIVVKVMNHNTNEIFDYPGFVLLDDNGDTVALETVNYFGIGQQSVHLLNVRPGVHDSNSTFNGTLRLYSGFFQNLECEWSPDQSFCPNAGCDSLIIGFQNWGGALVLGDFAWSLLDSTNSIIDSGVLTMTANEQYWFKGFCLPHARYSYTLYALGQPSGGGPTMTVAADSWYGSPSISQPFNWSSGNVLNFQFYDFCNDTEVPNGLQDVSNESPVKVIRNGESLQLRATDAMQMVEVFAANGSLVGIFNPNSDRFTLPTGLQPGLYIVRVYSKDTVLSIKILL